MISFYTHGKIANNGDAEVSADTFRGDVVISATSTHKRNTPSSLLLRLERSRLLAPFLVAEVRGQQWEDCESLAEALVERKLLTFYQVQKLLGGTSKGFYLGPYKVMRPLCVGGMGFIYLAEHTRLQRIVAIKVIRRRYLTRPGRVQRFQREAHVMAELNHPNVLHAFDYDTEKDVPYIVMEYVEGIDSYRQVDQDGPLQWQHAADYVRQAAEGLEHIHERGVFHRDVKPENLLVTPEGHVKIFDFGLSLRKCDVDAELPNPKREIEQVGTWEFTAPEQARDSRKIDPRADVYALGGTFYFLLTGKMLFPDCETPKEKAHAHKHIEPPHITEHAPHLPAAIADIVHKMLAKNPDDRFQNAGEVSRALLPYATQFNPAYDKSLIRISVDSLAPLMGLSPLACDPPESKPNQSPPITESDVVDSPTGSTICSRAELEDTIKTECEPPPLSDPAAPAKSSAKRKWLKLTGLFAVGLAAMIASCIVVWLLYFAS